MDGLAAVCKVQVVLRNMSWASIGMTVEHQAVSVVAQAVERGRGEQTIGRERLIPFGQIEVARDDGGRRLVTFGDQFMQVLVGGRTSGTCRSAPTAATCSSSSSMPATNAARSS
jgi:hypothetical protein